MDELFDSYQGELQWLKSMMKDDAQSIFTNIGDTSYIGSYAGVAAGLGVKFLEVATSHHMLRRRNASRHREVANRLAQLKTDYDALIVTKIAELCLPDDNCPHIWGISTYDHTAFNALYLAGKIREHTQPTAVIMGGDYWDYRSAWKLMKERDLADGVVVGYGERVLEEIIKTVTTTEHRDVAQLDIVGLINKRTIEREERREGIFVGKKELKVVDSENHRTVQTFNVPMEYKGQGGLRPFPFKMVVPDIRDPDLVRVMPQRGCSFGACQFCTQIDKNLFFSFPVEELLCQLKELFEGLPQGKQVQIRLDSDEISEAVLVTLIEFLADYDDQIKDIVTWLQIKVASRTIAEALLKAGNASKWEFSLNWESINPDTLKHMGKGHSPLQIIAASKAILDTGASFYSNYFLSFPRQDRENKEQELSFLLATQHLAAGRQTCFSYAANSRDDICRQAKDLGIVVKRKPADVWIHEAFQTDLEFSFWMYEWRTQLRMTRLSIVKRLFEASIRRVRRPSFPLFYLFAAGVAFLLGYGVFVKIGRVYLWLARTSANAGEGKNTFSIKGNTLIRRPTAPPAPHGWKDCVNVDLSPEEMRVLRAVYWPATEAQLADHVSPHLSSLDLKPIISRLESLGAIVRYSNKMVSVVNDPDYWSKGARDTFDADTENSLPPERLHAVGA